MLKLISKLCWKPDHKTSKEKYTTMNFRKYSLKGAPLFKTLKPFISETKKDILIG
jgi:hypothetical protein